MEVKSRFIAKIAITEQKKIKISPISQYKNVANKSCIEEDLDQELETNRLLRIATWRGRYQRDCRSRVGTLPRGVAPSKLKGLRITSRRRHGHGHGPGLCESVYRGKQIGALSCRLTAV